MVLDVEHLVDAEAAEAVDMKVAAHVATIGAEYRGTVAAVLAWDSGNWLGVVALVVTLVLWSLERRARLGDKRGVLVDVRMVERKSMGSTPGPGEVWWRITLLGGTPYSRATLTRLDWEQEGGTANVLAATGSSEAVLLVPGQPIHLRGIAPTFGN
jgi:hypothetical protein